MKNTRTIEQVLGVFFVLLMLATWGLVGYAAYYLFDFASLTYKVAFIFTIMLMIFGTLMELDRIKKIFGLNFKSIIPMEKTNQKNYQIFNMFLIGMAYGLSFIPMIEMGYSIVLLFITILWIFIFIKSIFFSPVDMESTK